MTVGLSMRFVHTVITIQSKDDNPISSHACR